MSTSAETKGRGEDGINRKKILCFEKGSEFFEHVGKQRYSKLGDVNQRNAMKSAVCSKRSYATPQSSGLYGSSNVVAECTAGYGKIG